MPFKYHWYAFAGVELNVTLPLLQIVVLPFALIDGAEGIDRIFTVTDCEVFDLHPLVSVIETE